MVAAMHKGQRSRVLLAEALEEADELAVEWPTVVASRDAPDWSDEGVAYDELEAKVSRAVTLELMQPGDSWLRPWHDPVAALC